MGGAFQAIVFISIIGAFLSPPELLRRLYIDTKYIIVTSLTRLIPLYIGFYVYQRSKRRPSVAQDVGADDNSIYGLEHGRLHIPARLPMWMNMGFWDNKVVYQYQKDADVRRPVSLASASRTLLSEVLRTAGLSRDITQECMKVPKTHRHGQSRPTRFPSTALLDVGFGCGEQTAYLTFPQPARGSDREWWDIQPYVPLLETYYGITLDAKQCRYAQEREHEFRTFDFGLRQRGLLPQTLELHCADASRPETWEPVFEKGLYEAFKRADERWVLALDTLYHFSPSRWGLIKYACQRLDASFMAFDLCLTDDKSISWFTLLLFRILTRIMGAPWANFITPEEYKTKLVEAGYREVIVRDVSEHVFAGLAEFLDRQSRVLSGTGLGLGRFRVAKWMFTWWARTGVVRGVIFVARKNEGQA